MSVRTTPSPQTFIIVALDHVVDIHVVNRDRCVLTEWGRSDTDSWTRVFHAH